MLRFLLLTALATPCLAAAPPEPSGPSRDQLRNAIDPRGRVTDPELREQTGWEVIRGFTWRIELEKDPWRPGKFTPVDPGQPFHNGNRFRFQIEATGLAKPRRENQSPGDAQLTRLAKDAGHKLSRHDHRNQIRRSGQLAE